VVCDNSLHRMDYVGDRLIFQFSKIEGSVGSSLPKSIIGYGQNTFYYSQEGFKLYSGAGVDPIGSGKTDKYFEANLDYQYRARMTRAIDPRNKLLMYAFPGPGNVSGRPNRMLCYKWDTREWSCIEALEVELLFNMIAAGLTLENLDSISSSLDALPASLDSGLYTDGRYLLAGADSTYRVGGFNGDALEAIIDTGEVNLSGDMLTYLKEFRASILGNTLTDIAVKIFTRDALIDTPSESDWLTPTIIRNITSDDLPSARYHRLRMRIQNGFSKAMGFQDVKFSEDGYE
jgi:hypothetical protein